MTVATDIAALKARCTALETRAKAAEAKNVAHDELLAGLRSDVNTLKVQVAELQSRL